MKEVQDNAVNELIDELAELRGLFEQLSQDGEQLLFEDLLTFCASCNESVSSDVLGNIWSGVNHGRGLAPLGFDQFLEFLSFCDPPSSHAADNIAAALHVTSAEGETQPIITIRSILTKHIRTRPDFETMKARGMYHSISNDLQREMAKDKLKRTLERRPSLEALTAAGIASRFTPTQVSLQRQLIHDALKRSLSSSNRPLMSELENRGVVKRCSTTLLNHAFTTASLLAVERNLRSSRLKHELEKMNRPDVAELTAQGIFVGQTATQHLMERNLVKSQLNRKLKDQPELDELKAKGIFEDGVQ